jgi:hypothetical protein
MCSGEVGSRDMAGRLNISETATCSILNTIKTNYPDFILLRKGDGNNRFILSSNAAVRSNVKRFLAEGGFTALNEREYRAYECGEIQEDLLGQPKRILKEVLLSGEWVES